MNVVYRVIRIKNQIFLPITHKNIKGSLSVIYFLLDFWMLYIYILLYYLSVVVSSKWYLRLVDYVCNIRMIFLDLLTITQLQNNYTAIEITLKWPNSVSKKSTRP